MQHVPHGWAEAQRRRIKCLVPTEPSRKCGRMHTMTEHPEPEPQASLHTAERAPRDVEQLRQDILRAFDTARQSGRSDWQKMTIAVLKNRLLDLTERTFDEKSYGFQSMGELVEAMPNLVLDPGSRPPTVRLLADDVSVVELGPPEEARVRPDLWNAVIDYRSGKSYTWDGAHAIPEGQSSTEYDSGPIIPTISESSLDSWRQDFARQVRPLVVGDPRLEEQLDRWLAEQLPAKALPSLLRGRWSATLKDHVVERLTNWFSSQEITPPADLVQPRRKPKAAVPPSGAASELRELIMRCVRAMTEEELRELRLPPAAVLRAQR